MKHLLYLAFKDLSNPYLGAFSAYGIQVSLAGRCGASTILTEPDGSTLCLGRHTERIRHSRLRSLLDKHHQIHDLLRWLHDKHFDACYIRYDFSDPDFLRLLRKLRPRCRRIVLEIPTYPYEGENRYGLASRLRMGVDRVCRQQLHRYIDHIVTFYDGHDTLFGIPVLVIPNGFDFSSTELVASPLAQDAIHIAAVSSMRQWHGYERILEGLSRYYANEQSDQRNFVVHLVGHGRLYDHFQKLVTQMQLQEHVILEGALHGQALQDVYERCAMGIDSLGRHRSGIGILSSLKSREYAAKGLPIINSCPIDVIEPGFPYLLLVPADESPLDLNAVAEFYDHCFAGGKSRQEVGAELRSYMEARCDMARTLGPVVERLFP